MNPGGVGRAEGVKRLSANRQPVADEGTALPRANHAPPGDDDRLKHAVIAGNDALMIGDVSGGSTVAVTQKVFVKGREQSDGCSETTFLRCIRNRPIALRSHPIADVSVAPLCQACPGDGKASIGVCHRELAPPDEIVNSCGSVTANVPHDILSESFIAIQISRVLNPFVEEHQALSVCGSWAPAQGGSLREIPDHVIAPASRGRDAILLKEHLELVSRELTPARERVRGEFARSLKDGTVKPERCVSTGSLLEKPPGAELQHPTQIFGGNQVQCAAHRPRAHDITGVERRIHVIQRRRLGAPSDRPLRSSQILCLRCKESLKYRGRGGKICGEQALCGGAEKSDFFEI